MDTDIERLLSLIERGVSLWETRTVLTDIERGWLADAQAALAAFSWRRPVFRQRSGRVPPEVADELAEGVLRRAYEEALQETKGLFPWQRCEPPVAPSTILTACGGRARHG